MMETMTLYGAYTLLTCCYESCGVTFGVTAAWERVRREDHAWWYCPHGHKQHFAVETDAERLTREKAAVERQLGWEKSSREVAQRRAVAAEHATRAVRGHLTRIKRRVAHGACPCCHRSFADLRRHMEGQHPEFAVEAR